MEKTYDLIIIGSGPAGLSAAIYAQRAGLDTLVLEKEYISGGQVVNTAEVDNYPGLPGMNGYELGMKFRSHADALEAKFQIAAEDHAGQRLQQKCFSGAVLIGHPYDLFRCSVFGSHRRDFEIL